MKFKWLKSNRSIIKFLLMLFITSILVGIYLYLSKEKLIRESINTELIKMINNLGITRQENILNHLLIFDCQPTDSTVLSDLLPSNSKRPFPLQPASVNRQRLLK